MIAIRPLPIEVKVITGAIYTLHELALEEEKYRQQIVQILCSHIRSKTNEQEYKKNHEERPSNEIQTTLDTAYPQNSPLDTVHAENPPPQGRRATNPP
jgi:hypothetical protein